MQQDEGYFMVSNFVGSNSYAIPRYVESNFSQRKISFLMVLLKRPSGGIEQMLKGTHVIVFALGIALR